VNRALAVLSDRILSAPNLFVSTLQRFGSEADRFAFSNGTMCARI